MRAQIVVDVIHVSIALILNMLHQNHIGVTCERTSNFRMESVRSMPLYFVAMPQFIIIVIEPSFLLAPIHTIDGARSITQTPRAIEFVNLHENIPGGDHSFC
jgi:hypothetical protein